MNYVYLACLVVAISAKINPIGNLDKWVANKNYTLVFITRDDCVQCSQLEAALTEAEGMISIGSPGSFGVDVVKISDYPVSHYPVLRLYVKGLFTEHQGPWEKRALEDWVDQRVLCYLESTNSEPSLRWLQESYNQTLIVFSDQYKQELKWLNMLRKHIHFTYSTAPNARELVKAPEDATIVFWTEKGNNTYYYEGEFNYERVFKFIQDHEQRYYQELSESAIQLAFYESTKPTLFIFDSNNNHRDIAKVNQKFINTVTVEKSQFQYDRLVEFLGVKGLMQPFAVIYDRVNNQHKYRTSFKDGSALKQFVSEFNNGRLSPYFKSAAPSSNENWEKQILNVVGEDFPKHADIIIYYYADWCKVCQEFNHVYEELFRKYKGQRAFGKLNIEFNEVIDQYISDVPQIRLYRQKDKKIVQYDGELTLDGLSEYVEKHLHRQVSGDL